MRATVEGPSGRHRQTYAKATMWNGGYAPILHKQPTCKVCSQKTTAKDGFAEGFRTQQFLKFRFSKGTNVELKLRSTLQPSAGLVVFYTKLENLTLRKNPSCQRLHRNWRFRDRRIFCWKTPCGQCLWVAAMDMIWKLKWEISPSLAEVYVWAAAIIYWDQVFGR